MRPLARAAALVVVTVLASPGCIVAIGTPVEHEEDDPDVEDLREHERLDADAAYKDKRILDLEERMGRLEQRLAK
jgi:hypothetical protein